MNAHADLHAVALPANIEVEAAVLGGLLINNNLMALLGFLRPEHFDEPMHRLIFEAAQTRITDGRPASILTLAADLPPTDDPQLTVSAYLAHLAASAITTGPSIVPMARELLDLAAKRELVGIADDLREAATTAATVGDVVSSAELRLIWLADEQARVSNRKEITPDDVLAGINARAVSGNHVKGVASGLSAIDYRLGGFAPGEFIIVAGRPGMGKTALGLSLARRAAHVGAGVAFDSLEMTKAAAWHRLLSDEALNNEPIFYDKIERGRVSTTQLEILRQANERLKELPLLILDRGNRLSDLPGHIRAARQFLAKRGKELGLFMIDYLGLLQPGDRYAGQKVNEVGEISSTLKAIAKREQIAVVGLHQLNRATEARGEDRRPRLSDLRDSGNIEQDADVVIFVHREAYYIERPGYRTFPTDIERQDAIDACGHQMEAIVAKQRQGSIGTCNLWCDMATNSVRDVARQ